jgi:ATP-binding cassette subfamily B protein
MYKILKVFYRFTAQQKAWFALFLLTVVASSILSNITPFFYKVFVDRLPSLDLNFLFKILLIYAGVRVLAMFVGALSFTVGDFILIKAASNVRSTIFKYIQDLDFAFHVNKSTGSLISAFKRGDGAFFNFHHSLHYRILNIFVAFIVMVVTFVYLDLYIALLTVIAFLLILIAARFVVGYNIQTRKRFNEEEDNVSSVIVDTLINYETVKLFAKEDWEMRRLANAFVPWKKSLWSFGMSFRVFDLTLGTLINLSIFLTLLISLVSTVKGKSSLGDFVLVVGFVNSFYPQVFDLVWGFRDLAKNYADIEKYFGLLDQQIQVKDPEKPLDIEEVKGEIDYKNVRFSYKGGKKNALNGINLKVRQGQSVAFVGRSGSGKTTMIKTLMRFYDLDEGEITIDNHNIKNFTKSRLRSFMGVVPQEPILFNNTIAYNIGYGNPEASFAEIRAAAKIANIDDFIVTLPKKYQTNVGERGIKLSGGQKQRLAIARMIISDPDIIIFDEATSHLDSESEAMIQESFWKASKNKTTIIVAHRLSTVMRADKIVVLEKGKIIETGSHKELLAKDKSLYGHFWELQAG